MSKFLKSGNSDSEEVPYFEKSLYQVQVKESEPLNQPFVTVAAENQNKVPSTRYEIVGGNTADIFEIDSQTGGVSLTQPLDYETKQKYTLRVSVNDVSFTSLEVSVVDVNDHPPVFEKPVYTTTILEEDHVSQPKKILQVNVTDADRDRPRNIVYSLTGPGVDTDDPSSGKFFINKLTGEVFVLKPLDRDLPHGRPQWKFTVFAQDEGGEGLVGYADILVNLKDVNDNPPVFPQSLCTANITENGTSDLVVLKMTAVDNDDPQEDRNAQLTYNIEKNVLDEVTGTPIFSIDPTSGLIRTNICCLDREKTPDYSLQIVAVDGGGLKGTGTVSIFISDINDMPPSFTKPEWETEVVESVDGSVPEHAVLTVNVVDQDEHNDFFYRVVEGSGSGTELFAMVRNPDGTGSLKIVKPLDFEDPLQRPGFRFKIQVNDQGPNGTEDSSHVAYSWVTLHLRDLNDNDPVFTKSTSTVSLREDVPLGTLVDIMAARDPDQGGEGKVIYRIDKSSDKKRQFRITEAGEVIVQRELDRETCAVHRLTITAEDDGDPVRTSTATLTLSLEDVNDNAPLLEPPSSPVIMENSLPGVSLELRARDLDNHTLGNGPPYTFTLDGSMEHLFSLHTDPRGDEGRGIGILKSLVTFDREEQKQYLLPVVVQDAGDPVMSVTSTLTVTIGDVNDNVMADGEADVLVYKLKDGEEDMPIGQVYVRDPDDWDRVDKTFSWDSAPLADFHLDQQTGSLSVAAGTPGGEYQLQFRVKDSRFPSGTVFSKMTVKINELSNVDIESLSFISLDGITDVQLVRKSGSAPPKIDVFRGVISDLANTSRDNVHVISVQSEPRTPAVTHVWFLVKEGSQYFKPVRLHGLLLMNREVIETSLSLQVHSVGLDQCEDETLCEVDSGCSARYTLVSSSRVVNANTSALAGPELVRDVSCSCRPRDFSVPDTCEHFPCFNGGTCHDSDSGHSCTCPKGFEGPRCQLTSRGFLGSGWAWFPGFSPCSEVHISLEFITSKSNGTLVYQGPLAVTDTISTDSLLLEFTDGRPKLLLDLGSGSVNLTSSRRLDDGHWHRLDVLWDSEEVRLVVDLCEQQDPGSTHDKAVTTRDLEECQWTAPLPLFYTQLSVNAPLQLGGIHPQQFNWTEEAPSGVGLEGCVRNVFYNGEMVDLATPAWSEGTTPGCSLQHSGCGASCSSLRTCDVTQTRCSCPAGYTGTSCSTRTVPSTFLPGGFVKFSLNFEPDRFSTRVQLRFRTRQEDAELFRFIDQYLREYVVVEIRRKSIQVRMNLNGHRPKEETVRISHIRVNDGSWHFVKVSRHGSTVMMRLDDGEGRKYNESFRFQGHQLITIDKQEGVYAGGPSQPSLRSGVAVASFSHGCLDDIRVDGHPLPLPPGVNSSQWGQASVSQGVERHCQSRNVCDDVKCPQNLTCQDIWNDFSCTCRDGSQPTADGKCELVDRCRTKPCSHGGVCLPGPLLSRGYRCQCPLGTFGTNCEVLQEKQSLRLGLTALITIVGCILLIVLLVVLFLAYQRRREAGVSPIQKTNVEDDVRENIISYNDEGGGEDDLNSFDLLRLKIPVETGIKLQVPELIEETSLAGMVESRRKRADLEQQVPPYDDIRNYAFEGNYDSCPGSLSSLDSDVEDTGAGPSSLGSKLELNKIIPKSGLLTFAVSEGPIQVTQV